jgi:hypothetical protein
VGVLLFSLYDDCCADAEVEPCAPSIPTIPAIPARQQTQGKAVQKKEKEKEKPDCMPPACVPRRKILKIPIILSGLTMQENYQGADFSEFLRAPRRLRRPTRSVGARRWGGGSGMRGRGGKWTMARTARMATPREGTAKPREGTATPRKVTATPREGTVTPRSPSPLGSLVSFTLPAPLTRTHTRHALRLGRDR